MFEVSIVGRWAVLALSGEIDIASSGRVRTLGTDLVDQGVTDLTVDLSQVTLLDATAMGALVAIRNLVSSIHGRMVLVGVDELASRLLQVTGLDRSLPVYLPSKPPIFPPTIAGREAEEKGDANGLIAQFYRLAGLLLSEPTMTGDFKRILGAASTTIPGCTAASIAIFVRGAPRTATVSSHTAIDVDLAQHAVNEGPCLLAGHTARRVRVDVLAGDDRFAHFAPLAIEAGIQATLSAPIILDGEVVGSLNLYSGQAYAFDAAAEPLADILAAQAATAIDLHRAEDALSVLHACSVEHARQLLRTGADIHHGALVESAHRLVTQLECAR